MKFENLVKRFNETTIKDDVYGAMSNIEEIKEAFGLDINIQEETQYFQLEDGRYITFDFDFKANSTWIYIDFKLMNTNQKLKKNSKKMMTMN